MRRCISSCARSRRWSPAAASNAAPAFTPCRPPEVNSSVTPQTAEWRRSHERGSRTLLRAMARLSLRMGRPAGRLVLPAITAYFFLFAPKARQCMRQYLRRVLSREPRAYDRWRLMLNFATAIHDRVYLLAERYHLFDVTLHGEAMMKELVAQGGGAVLMGAHVGSFEILRWIGERQPNLRLAITMYEENARKDR